MDTKSKELLFNLVKAGMKIVPVYSDGTPVYQRKKIKSFKTKSFGRLLDKHNGASFSIVLDGATFSTVKAIFATTAHANMFIKGCNAIFKHKVLNLKFVSALYANRETVIVNIPVVPSMTIGKTKDIHGPTYTKVNSKNGLYYSISILNNGFTCVYSNEQLEAISKGVIASSNADEIKSIDDLPFLNAETWADITDVYTTICEKRRDFIRVTKGTKIIEGDNAAMKLNTFEKTRTVSIFTLKSISGLSCKQLSSFLRNNKIADIKPAKLATMQRVFTDNGRLNAIQTESLIKLLSKSATARALFCPDFRSSCEFMAAIQINTEEFTGNEKTTINEKQISADISVKTIPLSTDESKHIISDKKKHNAIKPEPWETGEDNKEVSGDGIFSKIGDDFDGHSWLDEPDVFDS